MAMELKLDDQGHVAVQDGKPVYVQDGKDIAVDANELFSKVQSLNGEAKGHRLKFEELSAKVNPILGLFNGVDDIQAWHKDASSALETVKNIDQSKLLEADKVESFKAQITESFEQKITSILDQSKSDIAAKDSIIAEKDKNLRTAILSSKFSSSKHFSGEDQKTVFFPDAAEKYFGSNFRIEPDEKGNLRPVAYVGDKVVFSRSNPAEPAGFDEAIDILIEQSPDKSRILRAGSGGSGSGSNLDSSNDDVSSLKKQLIKAREANNFSLAMNIKGQLAAQGVHVP